VDNEDKYVLKTKEQLVHEELFRKRLLQGIAIVASAIVCAVMLNATHGESGMGWFILSLLIILGL
jgi:hypothetical protein